MRQHNLNRFIHQLLPTATDDREWEELYFFNADNELKKSQKNKGDEYELSYLRFVFLMDFYYPDMKSEAPMFYNQVLGECAKYLIHIKEAREI